MESRIQNTLSSLLQLFVRPKQLPAIGTENHNIRILYAEIAFASIMGGIVTFNGVLVLRLGGTKELVALLNSMPALVAVLFSIPTAIFLQRRLNRERWMFSSLWVLRLGYGVVALIPLLFRDNAATILVVWLILLTLPSVFFMSGFQALLGDLVPQHRRASVFSVRAVLWSLGAVAATAIGGQWLDRVETPLNFVLLYAFGFVISLGSSWLLENLITATQNSGRVRRRDAALAAPPPPKARMTRPIARLLVNYGVYQSGLHIAGPLFAVYFVENLKATDGWIGLNLAAGSVGVILGNILWGRLLRRHDYNWGLRRAMLITWTYPVLLAIFPELTLIMLFNLVVNLGHPGVELSIMNVMLNLGEPQARTVYMSWFNTVINISAFVAPLIGVFLVDVIGLTAVFIVAGALRILGLIMFHINPVQEVPVAA